MARWRPFKRLRRLLFGKPRKAAKRPLFDQRLYFQQLLELYAIDTVIDVGANRGQFVDMMRERYGFRGKFVSIEPLPNEFADLAQKAANDPDWTALNLALGEADGSLPFNIAGNSGSSSFLPMLDRHAVAAPGSVYIGQVIVPIARLENVPAILSAAAGNSMLKIDTQGYELSVLKGAGRALDLFSLIYVEVSYVPLYENGPLIEDVIGWLRQQGFDPVNVKAGWSDWRASHQLQADVTFARRDRMNEVLSKVERKSNVATARKS